MSMNQGIRWLLAAVIMVSLFYAGVKAVAGASGLYYSSAAPGAAGGSPVYITPMQVVSAKPEILVSDDSNALNPGMQSGMQPEMQPGTVAVNSRKSVYAPGELAEIDAAVVDLKGNTVCDANVSLEVTDPQGRVTRLTSPVLVKVSKDCGKEPAFAPDYTAVYRTRDVGRYKVRLTAVTLDGVRSADTGFVVADGVAFDVERQSVSRLNPAFNYEMKLIIKANEDYRGEIVERLPNTFGAQPPITDEEWDEFECFAGQPLPCGARVNQTVDYTEVRWKVDLSKGDVIELNYSLRNSNTVPLVYSFEPLQIGGWREARQWQVVGDVGESALILFWDGATDTPDATWVCISCAAGNWFYNTSPYGASTFGGTQYNTSTHTHTATVTHSTPSANASSTTSGTAVSNSTHTHPITTTIYSNTTVPLSRNLKVIKYIGYGGIPPTLPAGVIAVFNASPTAGSWTRYSEEDGYYVRGSDNTYINKTTGNSTHNHNMTVYLRSNALVTYRTGSTSNQAVVAHQHGADTTTNTSSNEPPNVNVTLYKLNTAAVIPAGMIALFNATPSTTEWTVVSGASGAFNGKFIKGSAAYGGPYGDATHSHLALTVNSNTSVGTNLDTNNAAGGAANGAHYHVIAATAFVAATNLPPYVDIIFGYAKTQNTIPNASLTTPTNASYRNSTTVSFQFTPIEMGYGSGGGFGTSSVIIYYAGNGTKWKSVDNTSSITNNSANTIAVTLVPGAFLWNVNVTDNASVPLTGNATENYTVTVVLTNVSLSSPLNGTTNTTALVNFTFTPMVQGSAFVNCTTWIWYGNGTLLNSTNWNSTEIGNATANWRHYTFASGGTYLWNVECYTGAGALSNTSTQNYTVTMSVNTIPNASLTTPTNASYKNSNTVSFQFTPIEEGYGDGGGFGTSSLIFYYAGNGTKWKSVDNTSAITNNSANTIAVTLVPGAFLWNVNVTDNASTPLTGNATENYTVQVVLTNVSLSSPTNGSTNTTSLVNFTFTPMVQGTVGAAFVNCTTWIWYGNGTLLNSSNWNSTGIGNNTANWRHYTFASSGAYLWNVECYTGAGALSNTSIENFTVTIDMNTAPNVSLSSPANGTSTTTRAQPFRFLPIEHGLGSGGNFTNCSLLVYWANGSLAAGTLNTSAILNASSNTIAYTLPAKSGQYPWNVECYDNATTKLSNTSYENYTVILTALIDTTVNTTTIDFGTLAPNTANSSSTTAYPLVVTIYSDTNVLVDLSVNGSDLTSGGNTLTVRNITYSNSSSIPSSSCRTELNKSFTSGACGATPNYYTNWKSIAPTGADITKSTYWWISTPTGLPKGTYQGTVYARVIESV